MTVEELYTLLGEQIQKHRGNYVLAFLDSDDEITTCPLHFIKPNVQFGKLVFYLDVPIVTSPFEDTDEEDDDE